MAITALVVAALIATLAAIAPPFATSAAAATSPADCMLPMDGSVGRIDLDTFRRPIGSVRAVMLFVDFPDVPATDTANTIFEQVFSPQAFDWLAQSSYGKLSLQVEPLRHWLRMPELLSSFKPVNGALTGDEAKRYIGEAIALADPEVDFSGTQVVIIVPNREAKVYSRSSEGVYNPEEGWIADGHVLRAVVTLGSSVYARGYKVLAHETSHAFGLRDYYNAFGSPTDTYVGTWSVMGDPTLGGDHFAWDKWRMGWLTDNQVRCINSASRADYVLAPLETAGDTKALILRTGLQTAVVVEYRTARALDERICSTGVLIYKVNSALEGGRGPIRVADSRPNSASRSGNCSGELDDAAFQHGGRWTNSAAGLEIDVMSIGSVARIRVIRSKTFTPPVRHARSITTSSVPNATGTVTVTATLTTSGGLSGCSVGQPVSLQELKSGEWWTIRTANTNSLGAWTYTWTPAEGATYRLTAPERYVSGHGCGLAHSETLTNIAGAGAGTG